MTYAIIADLGLDAHTLQVGQPSPLRMIARLAYAVSSHRFFAAHMADTSHIVHLLSCIHINIRSASLEYHNARVKCKFFCNR